ncbi:MarR family transcriptional regulator [Streptomyces albus]|uniref:MarR family transcriptional regulator n=1 Tax=Streptomyces albus TaxID=1888 RepID=UPI003F1C11EB
MRSAVALDWLAPLCAPAAARWDAEADRRRQLRTDENLRALLAAQREYNSARSLAAQASHQRKQARAASKNPLSSVRRSARTADRAASQQRDSARSALRDAKRNYPPTLARAAATVHAAHAVPTVGLSALLTATGHDLTVWPASLSALAVGLNAGALWLGRRHVVAVVADDSMSAEEQQLMERLDPAYWVAHAAERGLEGTVTTPPEMTPGGIRCEVRLDGTWDLAKFQGKSDSIGALLGARTALRMRITSASRRGWAVLTLATRSAAAGVSSVWTPERVPADPLVMSLGVDTETGDEVLVPFDERLLVSGASGTGKSWSFRPLMATAHLRGDMVLIDGKGEEANVWEAVCRVAVEPDEITDAVDEAHAEMTRRKRDMKARGISVWDGRQLTVVIDEGQVILAAIQRDKERLQRLIELSSLGRSRGVVLWWATQYPVTDGSAPGVHKLIAPNLLTRFSLRVAGTTQAQVALDDCAHYAPHQIPEGREYRGHGYLKGYGPRMIRTWTLDDDGVRTLPPNVWAPEESESAPAPSGRPALRLVKDGDYLLAPPADPPAVPGPRAEAAPAGLTEAESAVLDTVRSAAGPVRQKDVVVSTGLAKGTVSKTVAKLVKAGHLVKAEDGSLSAAAGEVSA